MKTFFSNNGRRLLLGGVINLLLLGAVITAVIGPSSGTHAQTAWDKQDPFSVFCYFYYHDGTDPNADTDTNTCSQQSSAFSSILKQETIPGNYSKWPQQTSLDDLANAGLLTNSQTETPIKTQQDFQASIPATDQNLLTLFQSDPQFLPTLWTYNSTYDYLPSCDTSSSSSPQVDSSACSSQGTPASRPAFCSVNPQNFQYSNMWPTIGPMLLTRISWLLQNHRGQHIDTYGIYARLVLQDHCSVSTLAQSLLLKGQPVSPSQAYQLEQDVLVQTAIANTSNTPLLLALVWIVSQTNKSQLDRWFSAAIITNPINPNTLLAGGTPQPTPSSPARVSVDSGQSPSPVHIKIVGKNGQYYFEPPIVEASKGTTITWTNTSDTSFVITSDSKVFTASSPLAANQTFQWIPTTTGAFVYHSANSSSSIKGVIIVTS
jgi:plastocyanin